MKSSNGCGPKCLILMLLAAILAAGGLWMIITGIMTQMKAMAWTSIVLWYTGGFILWFLAKQCRWKACPMCAMR